MSRSFTLMALLGFASACAPFEASEDDCTECSLPDADTDTGTGSTPTDTGEPTEPAYDADLDGYSTVLDCNDADATVYPGASEVCDSVDNDCDEAIDEGLPTATFYVDSDGDGYGAGEVVELCAIPEAGYSTVAGDCNDTDSAFYPGAEDIGGDGLDTDCDDETEPEDTSTGEQPEEDTGEASDTGEPADTGSTDTGDADTGSTTEPAIDADADGYSVVSDCDDSDATINPGASEILDNEVDENCDGIVEVTPTENDVDGDGYESDVDCDDSDSAINPGATEVCDSVDNDCDGSIDEWDAVDRITIYFDDDGDSYGWDYSTATSLMCPDDALPPGYVTNDDDCDDSDSAINPGASEAFNEVDDDCDLEIDEDVVAIEVTYGTTGYYVLNAQIYSSVDEISTGWTETDTESFGTELSVQFTIAEYSSLASACGVRLNVSEGNPATDWLCSGSAIDTAAASVDVWFGGSWYDESDLVVWDAGLGNGSCSALLVVSTSSDCQP